MNCGSVLILNVSTRCGLSPNASRSGPPWTSTVRSLAIDARDQWVASAGCAPGWPDDLLDLVQQDRRRTAGPVLVRQARHTALDDRVRHFVIVGFETPSSAATPELKAPGSAHPRMILHRSAYACVDVAARAPFSSAARCSSVTVSWVWPSSPRHMTILDLFKVFMVGNTSSVPMSSAAVRVVWWRCWSRVLLSRTGGCESHGAPIGTQDDHCKIRRWVRSLDAYLPASWRSGCREESSAVSLGSLIRDPVASGIRCKTAGVVPGFMIRLGDGADSFGVVGVVRSMRAEPPDVTELMVGEPDGVEAGADAVAAYPRELFGHRVLARIDP